MRHKRILFLPIALLVLLIAVAFIPTVSGTQAQQNAQTAITATAPIIDTAGVQTLAVTMDHFYRPTILNLAQEVPRYAGLVSIDGIQPRTMAADFKTTIHTAPTGLAAGHRTGEMQHLRL